MYVKLEAGPGASFGSVCNDEMNMGDPVDATKPIRKVGHKNSLGKSSA